MATPYIVVGCPTTGGGQVLSGNSMFLIEGIPIACVGDKATCPKHKTVATIISGDPHMQIFGKAAARVNDSLSCGCKLLPKQGLVVQDNGPSPVSKATPTATAPVISQQQQDSLVAENNEIHKIQFQVIDEDTDEPFVELLYEIRMKGSGELLVQGYTDKSGKTALYDSKYAQEAVELITVDLSTPLPPL
ncbi:PAAR domain-containing protein [Acinetobacter vivianii]|uniref:PAAR domain-containing protein n=1 Tax=Acinetobacter vivianii TaxID=1776742 RepID=UPI004042C072